MSVNKRSPRRLEDVTKTLNQAKINPDNLHPVTQVLKFTNEDNNYKFLELTKDLQTAIENQEKLVVRGNKDDSIILCTKNLTFDVKEAETSNTILLLPHLLFPTDNQITSDKKVVPLEVSQLFHKYLEVRPHKPRFNKLRQILLRNIYKGAEYEDETEQKITTKYLLNEIQSSEDELYNELENLPAFQINGSWRVLDFMYQFRILSLIIKYCEELSIPLDQMNMDQVINEFDQQAFSKDLIEQVFNWYTVPSENKYKLNEDRVCRSFAEVILKPCSKFPLNEFLKTWKDSLPEGLNCNEKQLNGMAIILSENNPPCVLYFPEQNLSEDIQTRLTELFKARSSWPIDEIVPYIESLATADLPVKGILAKYARLSSKFGVKYVTVEAKFARLSS